MKSIRHRRGSLAEWESANPIIPDGEIALVKRDTGYDIAIGDGETPFSTLHTLGGRIVKNYTDNIITETVRSGDDLRYGTLEELNLDIENPTSEDFFATISFISGESPTTLSLPARSYIYFTGNDCDDGYFYPFEYMRYNMFLFYDGSLQGIVRGYYYE